MSRVCRYGGTSELGTFFFRIPSGGHVQGKHLCRSEQRLGFGKKLSANKAVQQGSAVAEMESFKPFSKCPGTEASCARWLILRSSKWANGGRTLFPIHHSSSEPHHVVAEQRSRTATLWPFYLRPSFLFWLSNISSLCSLALLIADSAAAGK